VSGTWDEGTEEAKEDPGSILAPLAKPGMTVVDAGAAMGFFSVPLARFVGDTGRVVCVDVQARMLSALRKKAKRRGLEEVIECRPCSQEDLGLADLEGQVDLALAVHVVHETAFPRRFLSQIYEVLRPGGKFLLIEPRGHVSESNFEKTRSLCREVGLRELELKQLRRSRSLLLERP
jgi:ubiquinone/menaquinone biosynthesis C-methylase UbiE